MAINVAELEASIILDASKLNEGVEHVKKKLGEIDQSIQNLNGRGSALSVALGNIGAQLVGKAFGFFKNLGKDALETSTYNERVRVSLEALNKEEIKTANSRTYNEIVGYRTVSVQQQILSATSMTKKEQKEYNKTITDADGAVNKLATSQARLLRTQELLAGVGKGPKAKPLTPGQVAVYNASLNTTTASIEKYNTAIQKGAALEAGHQATVQKITAAGTQSIAITKKRTELLITEAEAQRQAAEMAKKTIASLELMAIKSPFNKQDVVDAFKMLRTVGGFKNEMALQYTQGIADVGTVGGVSGDRLKNLATALGQMHQFGQLYKVNAKQIAAVIPGFFDELKAKLGVNGEQLNKMFRKGMITSDKVEPIIKEFFEKYRGQAQAASETLPGLIESLGDVKRFTLANFFTPIFEGFKPALKKIIEIFTDPSVQSKILAAGQKIGASISGFLTQAIKIIDPIWKAISSGGLNIQSMIKGITDALSGNAIPESWGKPLLAVLTFINDHGQLIASILVGISSAITALLIAEQVSKVMGILGLILGGLLTPIGLLGAALGLLYVGFQTNFGGIRDTILEFWAKVKPVIDQIMAGKIDFNQLISADPTGLLQPITDFIFGIPSVISNAVTALNKDGIGAAFDVLWGGFGLKAINIANALSAFVLAGIKIIKDNAVNIAGAFASWGASALGWINKDINEIKTTITAKGGLIDNIGGALGQSVAALELVIQPWLKEFAGKTLTPDEATMKAKVKDFVNKIGTTINNLGDLVKAVGITFSTGFWTAAGEDVTRGVGLFFEAVKKEFTLEKLKKAILDGIGGEFSIENILFGKKGGGKDFIESPIGELFNIFPKGQTATQFFEHYFTLPENRPENIKIPINVTLDIQKMINDGSGENLIKEYMRANGIYKVGDNYFYQLSGTGQTVSTSNANEVSIPIKPIIKIDKPTVQLGDGITGPITSTEILSQALPGMNFSRGDKSFAAADINLTMAAKIQMPITSTPVTLNGKGLSSADVHKIMFETAFPGTVLTSTGAGVATVTPITVTVPMNVQPTMTSTVSAGPTTSTSVSETVATNAGLTKNPDGTFGIPNASSLNVAVPINLSLSLPTLGKTDQTGSQQLDALIGNYLQTSLITKSDAGYTYGGTPISISIPVDIKIVNPQKTDAAGVSPIATSIAGGMVSPANIAVVSEAVGRLYNGGLTQFSLVNKLTTGKGGAVGAGSLAFTVGSSIGLAIAAGLDVPMKDVLLSLGKLTTKLTTMKDTEIPQLQTAIVNFSTVNLNVVGPNFDTFTIGPLKSMNDALFYQKSLIEGLTTAFVTYGKTVAGFVPPPNLGGAPAGGTGGTSGSAPPAGPPDVRRDSFFPDRRENASVDNRSVSYFTVNHMIDSEKVAVKTYKIVGNKVLEEMNNY